MNESLKASLIEKTAKLRKAAGVVLAAVAVGNVVPAVADAKIVAVGHKEKGKSPRVVGARELPVPMKQIERDVAKTAVKLQATYSQGLPVGILPSFDLLWSPKGHDQNKFTKRTAAPVVAHVDGGTRYFELRKSDDNSYKINALPIVDLDKGTGPLLIENGKDGPPAGISDPDGVDRNSIVTSIAPLTPDPINGVPTAHVLYRDGSGIDVHIGQTFNQVTSGPIVL